MSKRMRLGAWVVALVAALAVVVGGIGFAFAASGDTPPHAKTIKDNKDGTYTVALNVTGDAEKKPSKANVIVIFDTSSSMNTATGNTEVTYTPTSSTGGWYYQDNLYGLIDGEYRQLTRTVTGNWLNQTYHFWYNGQEYTGQRYTRQESNQSRLQAAEEAVNGLAAALLEYNGKDGNPDDTIEMALVDFANTAEIAQQPTTDYDTFAAVVNRRDAGKTIAEPTGRPALGPPTTLISTTRIRPTSSSFPTVTPRSICRIQTTRSEAEVDKRTTTM